MRPKSAGNFTAQVKHMCCSQPARPFNVAAYGMGCFHDISSVAFSSDAVIDLIPVDVTASLTIAAAAGASHHGPYGPGRARVYHSASAHSYPQHAPGFFDNLNKFWTCNPPPFRLPFTRWAKQISVWGSCCQPPYSNESDPLSTCSAGVKLVRVQLQAAAEP
jgi:hypothetical protein